MDSPAATGPALPLSVPAGACDCHVHVFDPARFPYAAARSYTPPAAPVAGLRAFHQRIGISRAVLVQPSVYGTDNACLLDALNALGPAARGIAVIDSKTTDAGTLQAMHLRGVRGVRLNVEGHRADPRRLDAEIDGLQQLLAPLDWVLQIYAGSATLARLAHRLRALPVRVVLDHFAGLDLASVAPAADLRAVQELLAQPHVHAKLSAPYRLGATPPAYPEAADVARALIATAPDRLVWASDWPHTGSSRQRQHDLARPEPFRQEDAGRTLSLLAHWAGDTACAGRILADNAARLYGFAPDR